MPEQLTKHPDVTLQVLRSAGARCAEAAPQEILTACPRERFCKLPGGEICVYGLADAPRMTQITSSDWRGVMSSVLPQAPTSSQIGAQWLVAGAVGLLLGLALGLVVARWRRRRR